MAPAQSIASACVFLGSAASLRVGEHPTVAYSFAQFVSDFGREYTSGSEEYELRASHFDASLARVKLQNGRKDRSWSAGVHDFMDWTPVEKEALNGYRPSRSGRSGHVHTIAALQTSEVLEAGVNATATSLLRFGASSGGMPMDGPSPPQRNQGRCGSCWAIAAVEAVEAQLLRQDGAPTGMQLSAQALVDCAPNPQHCGGTGGCNGATAAIGFEFIKEHGIPLELDLPYDGRTDTCPDSLQGTWADSRHRARLTGWHHLESNKAEPLMQSLSEGGPTVVAVDANDWFEYSGGIFDGCEKDASIGHAVLAKGYGEEAGKKYWLIQNSWGYRWGERGHIRLVRQDDGGETYCGTDRKPQNGEGCDGGPAEVGVCGTCGILYDPVFPEGARIESGSDAGSVPLDASPVPAGADSDRYVEAQATADIRREADASLSDRSGTSSGWAVGGVDVAQAETSTSSIANSAPASQATASDAVSTAATTPTDSSSDLVGMTPVAPESEVAKMKAALSGESQEGPKSQDPATATGSPGVDDESMYLFEDKQQANSLLALERRLRPHALPIAQQSPANSHRRRAL